MTARAQVESLLAIINRSALDALDEYEKHGKAVPVPDSLDKHPLDDAEDKLLLKKIVSKLEGACEQLCTTLAPPTHTVMNRAQDFGWACLRVAVQQKFADAMKRHPNGLHVNALSKEVNVHPMKLASVLRVLAAKHCFREVSPDVFANNRLSLTLLSDHPMSALVDLITTEGQKPASALSDYLVDPEYGQSLKETEAVFQYSNNVMGITFYDWLQHKVSPSTSAFRALPYMTMKEDARLATSHDERKVMMKAMTSMNEVQGALFALQGICDVGSGAGNFSRAILEKYPGIQVTQFDLPRTIAVAKQLWKSDFSGRVIFIDGDFFKEVPAQGCDIYYLRNIIHNWIDEKALTILKSVRASMAPNSRVLIHDHVLRHMDRRSPQDFASDSDGLDKAPEPLLPNYGAGSIRLYHQDLQMMMAYNARERTTAEVVQIA
ncbi:hypothetical protein CVT26_014641 [Gymnopilus dilepis]|uniref:O-methyltransferase C-terminal domain-containing protein n=1 Tax=Gymnopilus dilepis TaxID=231916 RepID=A0A409W3M0_9AGAR|nr:hypothetical protein CVT26_014641 [Gymnopilus dilepis]